MIIKGDNMIFTELNKQEFKKYLNNHELKSFLQTPEMAALKVKSGCEEYYVGIKEKNKILCATMMYSYKTKMGKYFSAPRGYLIDFRDKNLLEFFTKELKKYVKLKGGYVLNIEPKILYKERDIDGKLVENGFDNSDIYQNLVCLGYKHGGFYEHLDLSKQVRWAFVLPLEGKTKEEIFAKFKPNTRNVIRKNIKYGVKVKELGYADLGLFTEIVESSGNRKNFHSRTTEYYQCMYELFHDKGDVKFLVTELNANEYKKQLIREKNEIKEKMDNLSDSGSNKKKKKEYLNQISSTDVRIKEVNKIKKNFGNNPLMAGAMFMLYGDEIIYLFSGTKSEFLSFKSQFLLQWHIIQYGVDNNYKLHNFYGINGKFESNDDRFGVYTFKKGFNGNVIEYIGDFDLIVMPSIYFFHKILKRLKKIV